MIFLHSLRFLSVSTQQKHLDFNNHFSIKLTMIIEVLVSSWCLGSNIWAFLATDPLLSRWFPGFPNLGYVIWDPWRVLTYSDTSEMYARLINEHILARSPPCYSKEIHQQKSTVLDSQGYVSFQGGYVFVIIHVCGMVICSMPYAIPSLKCARENEVVWHPVIWGTKKTKSATSSESTAFF